jgi:hypothetical protein
VSITCPRCGLTSHHPKDAEEGYCARCHAWTSPPSPTAPPDEAAVRSALNTLRNWHARRVANGKEATRAMAEERLRGIWLSAPADVVTRILNEVIPNET